MSPALDIVTATVTRIVDDDDERMFTVREPIALMVVLGVVDQ